MKDFETHPIGTKDRIYALGVIYRAARDLKRYTEFGGYELQAAYGRLDIAIKQYEKLS